MMKYPAGTISAVKLTKLVQIRDRLPISDLPSTRMIKCASILPDNEFIGWQLTIPKRGLVDMTFFGSKCIASSDLEWITENCAKSTPTKIDVEEIATENDVLYKLSLNISDSSHNKPIGFGAQDNTLATYEYISWPTSYSNQFGQLIKFFRIEGATLRFSFGRANNSSAEQCRHVFEKKRNSSSINGETYFGTPINTSVLIRIPNTPVFVCKASSMRQSRDLSLCILAT